MRILICLFGFILMIISSCSSDQPNSLDQDFKNELAKLNFKLSSQLTNGAAPKADLSSLDYDFYLNYLTENDKLAGKRASKVVKNAFKHYFQGKEGFFVVALYYKASNTIVCDISNTQELDTMVVYNLHHDAPKLSYFVEEYVGF
jgi:hypothetical protein